METGRVDGCLVREESARILEIGPRQTGDTGLVQPLRGTAFSGRIPPLPGR